MIKTIFFDLDGTLLPMDQDCFIQAYMSGLAGKMAQHGYDPKHLVQSVWKGTAAMTVNDGLRGNEEVFWDTFCQAYGKDARCDEPIFLSFYQNEFQQVRHACGYAPQAAQLIRELNDMEFTLVLATNPLFPAIATHSRVHWAGLSPEDFSLITTYENSRFCKPNPDYYREILGKLGLSPEECLMVGNDVSEDMVAQQLGMQVFLLTDCLINKNNADISQFPHGSFPELMNFIRRIAQ